MVAAPSMSLPVDALEGSAETFDVLLTLELPLTLFLDAVFSFEVAS